jgi:hypothetical protein
MKASEFYHKISHIYFANYGLKTYYSALYEVLIAHQSKTPSWELFIEVLAEANEQAKAKMLISNELFNLNQDSNQIELSNLLSFLRGQIRFLENNEIPQDSYFNWNISIILERGAAWLTSDAEDFELPETPTWADLLLLIEMGREYE